MLRGKLRRGAGARVVAAGERARATKERARRACAISRLRASARSGEGLGSDGAAVGRALCLAGNADADVEYRSVAWRAWLGVGLGLGFGLALTLTLTLTLALTLALTLITLTPITLTLTLTLSSRPAWKPLPK